MQKSLSILQIESGSALSLLLSTTIFVITVVKICCGFTDEPLSICFLPQYSTPKKIFISERDQIMTRRKSTSVVYNFLAI